MKYQEINAFQRKLSVVKEFFKRPQRWKFLWYRIKWNYFPGLRWVPSNPLNVDVELADACNLRCVMCVHGLGTMKNVGIMEEDFAKSMIDQLADMGVYSMKFNWRGEAAMHKKLAEIIRYAKEKGIPEVQMNTNGIPFDEHKISEVIKAGMDRVIFSVDGNSKETYEKIRVGSNFDKLVNNIEAFVRIRKELGSLKPFLRVQMVRTNTNAHEVDGLIQRWKNKVEDIRISDVMDRGQGNHLTVGDQVSTGRAHCPQPFQRMIVARDGNVYPCCSDWYAKYKIGDAKTQPLKEIWKGERMNTLRKTINDDKMDDYEPCKNCYVKESYKWRKLTKEELAQKSKKPEDKDHQDEQIANTI